MLGGTAIMSMNQIWKSKHVSMMIMCRLVHTIVFPITTYDCESWTMKKMDPRKIEFFELWCWMRLLCIPWTGKTTNKEVLKHIKPDMSLEGKITKLILAMSCDQHHWRRMLCSERSVVKDDEGAKECIGWM